VRSDAADASLASWWWCMSVRVSCNAAPEGCPSAITPQASLALRGHVPTDAAATAAVTPGSNARLLRESIIRESIIPVHRPSLSPHSCQAGELKSRAARKQQLPTVCGPGATAAQQFEHQWLAGCSCIMASSLPALL
jgi:hypothetical protein